MATALKGMPTALSCFGPWAARAAARGKAWRRTSPRAAVAADIFRSARLHFAASNAHRIDPHRTAISYHMLNSSPPQRRQRAEKIRESARACAVQETRALPGPRCQPLRFLVVA